MLSLIKSSPGTIGFVYVIDPAGSKNNTNSKMIPNTIYIARTTFFWLGTISSAPKYIAKRITPGNHIQFMIPINPVLLSTFVPVIRIVMKSKKSPKYMSPAKK